jgi:hypothetical protein
MGYGLGPRLLPRTAAKASLTELISRGVVAIWAIAGGLGTSCLVLRLDPNQNLGLAILAGFRGFYAFGILGFFPAMLASYMQRHASRNRDL